MDEAKKDEVNLENGEISAKRRENETPLKSRSDETGRVISSPAHTKSHARHIAKGKVKTSSMKTIEAEAVTIGLPYLKARETVLIEGIGKKFSGSWRITQVRHEISNSGYTCTMNLCKNDFEGQSSSRKSDSAPKKSAGTGKNNGATPAGKGKSGTSKSRTRKYNLGSGEEVKE